MDVLLIDAQARRRQRIARALSGRGHDVRTASGPVSARAALRRRAPQLVALDGGMPGLPSGDLLAEMERDPRVSSARVVLMAKNAGSLFAAAVGLMGMRVVHEAEDPLEALVGVAYASEREHTLRASREQMTSMSRARESSAKLIEQTRDLLAIARASAKR